MRPARLLRLVVLALTACLAGSAAAGTIITATEFDPDGGRHTPGLADGAAIVDVNSELAFAVDRDALTAAIGARPGFASAELSQRIRTVMGLQAVVDSALALLPELARGLVLQRVGGEPPPPLTAVARRLAPLLRQVEQAFPVGADGARERISAAALAGVPGAGLVGRYEAALGQAAGEVARLRLDLDELARREGVYVQFGGWLTTGRGTVPIHLPGFDNHPDAEPYDVVRWDFSLSEAEKTELAGYRDFAAEYARREAALADLVWAQTRASLASRATLDSCLARIETALDGLQTTAAVGAGRSGLDRLRTGLAELQAMATTEHPAQDGLAVLLAFDDATRQLGDDGRALLDQVGDLVDGLPAAATADRRRLQAVLDECRDGLKALLADDTQGPGRLVSLVRTTRAVNLAALAFSDEVLQHDLADVPAATRLALRNTGVRGDGDVLGFKLAVGRGQQPPVALQEFRLRMHKVAPHVVTAPVLIFAQPNHSNVYQPAPAYSAVLARGSRSSRLYNQLWRPGLGVNLSLLDFDGDDNLELGFAGVATLLRDLLQVGYGINFGQNQGFWFVGLRLPMPGGSL